MDLTEAKRVCTELPSPKDMEWVPLEKALGRVLGNTLTAHMNLPREFISRMDGFAIRASDTLKASPEDPVALRLSWELIAAGHASEEALNPGEACRILTGAPLPKGVDCVAPQEEVLEEEGRLIIHRAYASGDWVIRPGQDVRQGEILALKGSLLTPTHLALIAALGHAQVPVHRRPRVALLATGDEVREIGNLIEGPFTICNNRSLLACLVRLQGGTPLSLGVARDDSQVIADQLDRADADLVITTGGTGQGERDFIRQAWKILGIRVVFRRLNLLPGKNSSLGIKGNRIFCGLSGNPWAAQIIFNEIVTALLWRWQGLGINEIPIVTATLKGYIKKKRGYYKAVRGKLNMRTLPPSFTPLDRNEGSLFDSMRDSLAYTLIEPQSQEVSSGSTVHVRLNDLPLEALPYFGLPLGVET